MQLKISRVGVAGNVGDAAIVKSINMITQMLKYNLFECFWSDQTFYYMAVIGICHPICDVKMETWTLKHARNRSQLTLKYDFLIPFSLYFVCWTKRKNKSLSFSNILNCVAYYCWELNICVFIEITGPD